MGLDPLNLDSLDSLREIPGVGEKIAGRMEDFFGSEEGALGRIREGDVASLSTVTGLTEAKASRIVRSAIAEEYGPLTFSRRRWSRGSVKRS
ncbi:hypothetical protein AKJ61_03050 [candidate division MSBL1 archaeon SCGC-AAA259B11]|uniref:Uncharacterized protein n=1 Tax=candidate division MSBL1 archaeon SCGC-AAA259B11 TaxID=1698260 RepID=A0A133U596_9EURY|nr:hypothetical protein AKJ61_03050 [candidate division MSBL1 archaeon SCGC-AAA259B11]